MPDKAFTVQEANDALPEIESIFQRLDAKKAALGHHLQKLQVLDALWGKAVEESKNPDHDDFDQHRRRVGHLKGDIQSMVEDEIIAMGVRFPPGGLEHGLLDFPTTFEGRWVFICWKRGEAQVEYWHEIEGGFAGRREILAEHIIAMGRDGAPSIDSSELDF
jgi:hypothetical protein